MASTIEPKISLLTLLSSSAKISLSVSSNRLSSGFRWPPSASSISWSAPVSIITSSGGIGRGRIGKSLTSMVLFLVSHRNSITTNKTNAARLPQAYIGFFSRSKTKLSAALVAFSITVGSALVSGLALAGTASACSSATSARVAKVIT